MFNFANLNDVEFEYLCKDIMSESLGVELQRFAQGRDGGIDLTDNVFEKNVIVQVKHYIKTDFSGLIASLKKELPKVEKNNPKQFYVCCSKELSPQNKVDIYNIFADHMESDKNIWSLIDINDFLEREENAEILRRHFKLWIDSTNVLQDILTKDISIDSDALLYDISDSVQMFVKTTAYEHALDCLSKNNVLIIIGNPGVGKTMTSKMLVLYYVSMGYWVRYTTDGTDLASLKRALAVSPETKEIILLDDCFGQAYFRMKETQEDELLMLIKHIKCNPNKVLIMNSRVTIYQEAQDRTPNLVKSLERKEYRAFVLDMDRLSLVEKAKIFYNHLYFSNIPQEYRENIKRDKKYRTIVSHTNYNPRIIENVCNLKKLEKVKPEQYAEYIIQCLQNPEWMWKNEYERRLSNIDRMLLTTIYSLTSTMISKELVKKCFEHRISRSEGVDLSINHFEQSIKRLSDSMIKIVDVNGMEMLSTANPSVNDFLDAHLEQNYPEKKSIVETSISPIQLKRMLAQEAYDEVITSLFETGEILRYEFTSEEEKQDFIIYNCAEKRVMNQQFAPYLEQYIKDIHMLCIEQRMVPKIQILEKLFEEEMCRFYGLDKMVRDIELLRNILQEQELYAKVLFIKQINYLFDDSIRDDYVAMVKEMLREDIIEYCDEIQAEEYDIDVESIVEDHRVFNRYGSDINIDAAAKDAEEIIKDFVLEDIHNYIENLPNDLYVGDDFFKGLVIHVDGTIPLIEQHLYYDDDYYDDYESRRENTWSNSEVDYIFER